MGVRASVAANLVFPSVFMFIKQRALPSRTSVVHMGKRNVPLDIIFSLLANFYFNNKERFFVPLGCSTIQFNLENKPLKY